MLFPDLLKVVYCYFVMAVSVALKEFSIRWGKGMEGHSFLLLSGISLHDCYNECQNRLKCRSLDYYRNGKTCMLNNQTEQEDVASVKDKPGHVFSDRLHWNGETQNPCGSTKTYDEDNAGQACSVTECDGPEPIGESRLLGNRNSVGMKIRYVCFSGETLTTSYISTCLANRSWSKSITFSCDAQAGNPQVVPRQARQSSTSYGGVAERAIDGNWESDWSGASCTATAGGPNQWLEVEYESLVKVTRVKMQNRRNCCPERLHDVLITVDGVECGFFKGPGTDGQLVIVDCHYPLVGTVVRFLQTTGTNIMTLCEVGIE